MCGICGVFDFDGRPAEAELVRRMSASLQHRGPDGDGYYFSGEIGLGHRRLSIIDLAGGGQPIATEDGALQIVFNGELYNYIELREELLQRGHVFCTQSDTEVLLHSFQEWGLDSLRRFNGIFAFAIWDSRARQLTLGRDHLGVKPLYYATAGRKLLFASEIKALLQDSKCAREVDLESLSQLFTLRYVPSPKTMFRGIYKLPPGHYMVVNRKGIAVHRFWDRKPVLDQAINEATAIEKYQELVESAVTLQMRSDVPVGLFLSSGVDSNALLALMSQRSSRPVRTFTIGFENGETTNETDDARQAARRAGAEHTELIVSAKDYLTYYDRYLWDLEEPVGNESAAAFYFVSRLTSQSVKVALTGQGADEPWAGYHRYIGARLSEHYSRLPRVLTEQVIRPVVMRFANDEKWRRGVVALSESDVLSRLVKVYSFYSSEMKAQLFRPWLLAEVSADGAEARKALGRLQSDVDGLDVLTQMTYIDTRGNLPDDLLMVGDKMAMANSLEARVPFLDYRLVEFAETLPPSFKLHGLTGKYLHKRALEKWVPREVVYRKKKGFANPVDHWLRSHMGPFVRECLMSDDSAVSAYFNRSYVQKLVRDHESGAQNYMRHLYLLISFEMWHRRFIAPVCVTA